MTNKYQTEWLALFFISGFITAKLMTIINPEKIDYYSIGFIISLLFWLLSAAKAGLFNVFIFIRKLPKNIWKIILYFYQDYKYWKINGVRKP